jgi:hypothetical protein
VIELSENISLSILSIQESFLQPKTETNRLSFFLDEAYEYVFTDKDNEGEDVMLITPKKKERKKKES